ncbi:MAG TPA: cupin domain-containing protein [Sphingomonadaceae bacterium]|nr:cupin domain-containing protein [Sphingomonadaceae bacterium]
MKFTSFDPESFLRDYWQKKPLLIRNPWASWNNPLEPDELAGLACEAAVESRLITQGRGGLRLEHGPLPDTRFAELGTHPWTLLVQAVDHQVPDVAALMEPFRFIPNWRVDDVMVSYATDRGGVGPHFDRYDVFLLQGLGRRRWQIGARCNDATALLPHDDLRLLANFEATDEWVLEPGDILYVPPRVSHNGVAVGDDCMTYSIGFRAPSREELIADWYEHLLAEAREDQFYEDPDLGLQPNPGEIAPEALARLRAMIAGALLDGHAFARWFGIQNSAPKNPNVDWRPDRTIGTDDLRACLAGDLALSRNPASRFSFVRRDAASILLFVDGQVFDCAGDTVALAERICAEDRVERPSSLIGSAQSEALVLDLLNRGSVAFVQNDRD